MSRRQRPTKDLVEIITKRMAKRALTIEAIKEQHAKSAQYLETGPYRKPSGAKKHRDLMADDKYLFLRATLNNALHAADAARLALMQHETGGPTK